jgi:hypothetical protein
VVATVVHAALIERLGNHVVLDPGKGSATFEARHQLERREQTTQGETTDPQVRDREAEMLAGYFEASAIERRRHVFLSGLPTMKPSLNRREATQAPLLETGVFSVHTWARIPLFPGADNG